MGGMKQGLCRAGKESSPAHPPAEALLPACLPSAAGLSWGLLCCTSCILPVQTHLLSGGCLTLLSCCSKPCSLQTHSPPPCLAISTQPMNLGVAHYFACFQPRSCQTSTSSPSITAWPEAAALSSMGSFLHFPEPQVSTCCTTASTPHH